MKSNLLVTDPKKRVNKKGDTFLKVSPMTLEGVICTILNVYIYNNGSLNLKENRICEYCKKFDGLEQLQPAKLEKLKNNNYEIKKGSANSPFGPIS